MESVLEYFARYSVEFIKLLLVVHGFLKIDIKRNVALYYGVSLLVCAAFLIFITSDFTIIYGIIAIAALTLASKGRHRLWYIIFSYLGISVLDLLIFTIFGVLFNVSSEMVEDNLFVALINSVSLSIIVVGLTLNRFRKKEAVTLVGRFLPIYIPGGLFLAIYLTALQFMGMNGGGEYGYGVVVGMAAISVIFIIVCILLNSNRNENNRLKVEKELNERVMRAQLDYYTMLLKKNEDTRSFRHDYREHLSIIRMLYDKREYDELGGYLRSLEGALEDIGVRFNTGNEYVDAILTDLDSRYADVCMEWRGHFPQLTINRMDICTIFFNLLNNAYEAASKSDDKTILVTVKVFERSLLIEETNGYDIVSVRRDGTLETTKEDPDLHGYGIKNIVKTVYKYGGTYTRHIDADRFTTEIVIPNGVV
ncbi:MAG: GHKL domain-containing protein [Lachnospiraceae bacterium]|nr:GHKL domain-containing protein [Lachnospiraceae bacterium]